MRNNWPILALLGVVITALGGLSLFSWPSILTDMEHTQADKIPQYTAQEIIVRTKANTSLRETAAPSSLQGMMVAHNVSQVEKIPYTNNSYTVSTHGDVDPETIAQQFEDNPHVAYAELNHVFTVTTTPNDPQLSEQWAFNVTSAQEGWKLERGNKSVTIAIIDTGVQWNHSDLQDNVWNNTDEVANTTNDTDNNGYVDDIRGYDFVETSLNCADGEDCSTEDANPMDSQGHGTHTAGIAAAVTNNSEGIAGVCWNCRIMPVRAGFEYTTGAGLLETDDIVQAIRYATNNNASIISMSFGGSSSPQSLEDAIEYAAQQDTILIASAGNNDKNVKTYPAGYPEVISVAATNDNNKKASYSQFGSWVDVAAPGSSIRSTYVGNTYADASGTSMSAPYIAGIAGLLKSNMSTDSTIIRTMLKSATDPIDTTQYIGTGEINLSKALQYQSPIPAPRLSATWHDTTINRTITVNGTIQGNLSGNWSLAYSNTTYGGNWSQITQNTAVFPANISAPFDTRELSNTQHVFRLTAVNSTMQTKDTTRITVNNTYPVPEFITHVPEKQAKLVADNVTFNATVYANDSLTNVSLQGNWSNNSILATKTAHNGTKYTFTKNLGNDTGTFYWKYQACYPHICVQSNRTLFSRTNARIAVHEPAANHITNQTNVTINWTVHTAKNQTTTCNISQQNGTTIQLLSNGTTNKQHNTAVSFTNGTHQWHITCVYANNTLSSVKQNITIDTTPPNITQRWPNNATATQTQPITFRWQVNDSLTEPDDCTLTVNTTSTDHSGNTTTITTNRSLSEGVYNWTVSCNDTAGNQHKTAAYEIEVDRTAPDSQTSIVTNDTVLSPQLTVNMTVNFTETVANASLTVNNDTQLLCKTCHNTTATFHLYYFGTQRLTLTGQDRAGNTHTRNITFSLKRDTDDDGIADSNSSDADNDGIHDTNDSFIGTVSHIRNTTPLHINTENISGINNEADTLSQITITTNNTSIVQFTHNFSQHRLPLAPITILYNTSGSRGSIHVSGINHTATHKQILVPRTNTSDNDTSVCIQDTALRTRATFSEACNATGEIYINCNTSTNQYNCTLTNNNTHLRISNVSHTAAEERCTENWTCTEWSSCTDGTQTRNCTDTNQCGVEAREPITQQSCAVSGSSGTTGSESSNGGGISSDTAGSGGSSTAVATHTDNTTTPNTTETKSHNIAHVNLTKTVSQTHTVLSNTTVHIFTAQWHRNHTVTLTNGHVLATMRNTVYPVSENVSYTVPTTPPQRVHITGDRVNRTHITLHVTRRTVTMDESQKDRMTDYRTTTNNTTHAQLDTTTTRFSIFAKLAIALVTITVLVILYASAVSQLVQERYKGQRQTDHNTIKIHIQLHKENEQ